jgi:UDP-N-acetylmuramoyl-tripeptide--D-alanyl-D-alanine ligase
MVYGNGLADTFEQIEIAGVSIDSRIITKGNLFIPIARIKDGHTFVQEAIKNGATACLWEKNRPNPPTNFPVIFVENTLLALQHLAKNYRNELSAKVIGITGSNGKTTTKDTIHSILSTQFHVHKTKGNLNSEYGLPLTILSALEEDDILVLELGMRKRGEIEILSKIAQPDVGVITMIGSSHLATLGSREEIANAKLEIADGMKENGLLIFHGDEPLLKEKIQAQKNKPLRYASFGISNENDLYQSNVHVHPQKITFTLNDSDSPIYCIHMIGRHNVNNTLAAILVARECGIMEKNIITGLKNLELTEMRMQQLTSPKGYTIINDAWNANPNSVQASIETFQELSGYNRKILILGDMLELGEKEIEYHKEIGRLIDPLHIDFLFTYGELATYISAEAEKILGPERTVSFTDKQSLVHKIEEMVQPNDAVLIKGSRGMALEDVVKKLL